MARGSATPQRVLSSSSKALLSLQSSTMTSSSDSCLWAVSSALSSMDALWPQSVTYVVRAACKLMLQLTTTMTSPRMSLLPGAPALAWCLTFSFISCCLRCCRWSRYVLVCVCSAFDVCARHFSFVSLRNLSSCTTPMTLNTTVLPLVHLRLTIMADLIKAWKEVMGGDGEEVPCVKHAEERVALHKSQNGAPIQGAVSRV